MAMIVQSRFAGLKIEDDDFPAQGAQKKAKPKAASAPQVKKVEPVKKVKAPAKTNQQVNGSASTAGPVSAAGAKKKNNKKKGEPTPEQWEEWKQKDELLVDGNFENELQQAILLSKLDYEEKKDVYKQIKKDTDLEKKLTEQAKLNNNKKQKKKNVMSLEQFNDMVSGDGDQKRQEEIQETKDSPEKVIITNDTEFFERVDDEAKSELKKDKIIERIKQRKTVPDEVITRVQFAVALEKKDKEIDDLKIEVTTLKAELLNVKSRNKKLCNILGQGEMRDKAQVLVEVEKLRQVQSELTTEVESLHALLEQERSRNAEPRVKEKKKKLSFSDKEK